MNITIEQKASHTLALTASHDKTFAELIRDYNPPHPEVLPVHVTKPAT